MHRCAWKSGEEITIEPSLVTDSNGITTVYASTEADAAAEMQINMSRAYALTANDFIL